ncbi:hypothetical protein CB1_060782031 [Camelus ferus]|nr:hypothetical protein CB1_060782031 [Camelus ferus]
MAFAPGTLAAASPSPPAPLREASGGALEAAGLGLFLAHCFAVTLQVAPLGSSSTEDLAMCFKSNLPKTEKFKANAGEPAPSGDYSVPLRSAFCQKSSSLRRKNSKMKKERKTGSEAHPELSDVSLNELPHRWTSTERASQMKWAVSLRRRCIQCS